MLRDQLRELMIYFEERDKIFAHYIATSRNLARQGHDLIQTSEKVRVVLTSDSRERVVAVQHQKNPTRHPINMEIEEERELYFLGDALSNIYGAQLVIMQKRRVPNGQQP